MKEFDSKVYFCPFLMQSGESLDDEDGYLLVNSGDHILYRFEIKTILGKGSFA